MSFIDRWQEIRSNCLCQMPSRIQYFQCLVYSKPTRAVSWRIQDVLGWTYNSTVKSKFVSYFDRTWNSTCIPSKLFFYSFFFSQLLCSYYVRFNVIQYNAFSIPQSCYIFFWFYIKEGLFFCLKEKDNHHSVKIILTI